MSKKKKLPIAILKSLEPFVNLVGEKFKTIPQKDNLLWVLDIDSSSDFYFKIEKYELRQSNFQLLMDKKPKDESTPGNYRAWIDVKNLEDQFKSWIILLDQYDTIESFFDDPIIKLNAEKFYQKYEIVDDKADIETFDLGKQLFLEDYLDQSKVKLIALKQNQTNEKIVLIEELEKEAEEIKSVLTTESKKKVMRRLSRFWGKAQKTGLDIIKEILIRVSTDFTASLLQ